MLGWSGWIGPIDKLQIYRNLVNMILFPCYEKGCERKRKRKRKRERERERERERVLLKIFGENKKNGTVKGSLLFCHECHHFADL